MGAAVNTTVALLCGLGYELSNVTHLRNFTATCVAGTTSGGVLEGTGGATCQPVVDYCIAPPNSLMKEEYADAISGTTVGSTNFVIYCSDAYSDDVYGSIVDGATCVGLNETHGKLEPAVACTADFGDCPALTSPTNGNVSATGYAPGGLATFSRTAGYENSAADEVFGCSYTIGQVDSAWNMSDAPTCTQIGDFCQINNEPDNVVLSSHFLALGENVTYDCFSGYTFADGNSTVARTCLANGTLSRSSPVGCSVFPGVPEAPYIMSIQAVSSSEIYLSWDEPLSGSSGIIYYIVEMDRATGTFAPVANTSYLGTSVTGLTSSSNHTFRVAALNAKGSGNFSDPEWEMTFSGTPAEPESLSVTGSTATTATLSWSTPAGNTSAVAAYMLQYRDTDQVTAWRPLTRTQAPVTVSQLSGNTNYSFRVAARYAISDFGNFSSVATALTLVAKPGAPQALSKGAVTSASIEVSWSAPIKGGAVASYLLEIRNKSESTGLFGSWTTVSASATSPTNATRLYRATAYRFHLRAVNSAGSSLATSTEERTLATLPGIPTVTVAGSGSAKLVVSWTTSDNGGALIRKFEVNYGPADRSTNYTRTVSGATTSFTGVQPNTPYWARVRASNTIGFGQWSGSQSTSILLSAPQITTLSAVGSGMNVVAYSNGDNLTI
eukprot:709575_1